MKTSHYDKTPTVIVPDGADAAVQGWGAVADRLIAAIRRRGTTRTILAIECYVGVLEDEILEALVPALKPVKVIRSADAFISPAAVDELARPFLGGDDPVFGWLSGLTLPGFFEVNKVEALRREINEAGEGLILVIGTGATHLCDPDLLVYADMPRWEGQLRQRRNLVGNLGAENHQLKASLQYKRGYFIDWRVCDRWKRPLIGRWDFLLDTVIPDNPKLVEGQAVRRGLAHTASRPFRVVPFFDPAPWGGQWMKEVCDLDRSVENYGWCFDCVPEENSLLMRFGDVVVEMPSMNLVFHQPVELLGDAVHARFGHEFPIRFDFLDTVGGGNLSFQVHPLTEYIQEIFGMHYTQDESYYMLDAEEGATVYLGMKEGVDVKDMIADLEAAQRGEKTFDDERFVNKFPAKKHDHFLIPAGTVHCSGTGGMVLEISATPYIFTFKLWDWGRMGLDGLPRPINIEHGSKNIACDRTTAWVKNNLINVVTNVAEGDGWWEERTGLHEREFIETRRHWFTKTVAHHTRGGVNVLNLVEGERAVVESPGGDFDPFIVHYAETFIIPASVGPYTIRPHVPSEGHPCATLKAWVRTGEIVIQKDSES